MSKTQPLCLEQIYSRRPSLSRLESTKTTSELQDKFIRNCLSDEPFFKKIQNEFGEEMGLNELEWYYIIRGDGGGTDKQTYGQFEFSKGNSRSYLIRNKKPIRTQGPMYLQSPSSPPKRPHKSSIIILMLTKPQYNFLLQKHNQRQFNHLLTILNRLPVFSNLCHPTLSCICECIQTVKYQKYDIVYQQNQPANKLFIIKQGTFVVMQVFMQMNRYNQSHRQCSPVLTLNNYNIFGQQCLKYLTKGYIHEKESHYLCQVSCKSMKGSLYVLTKPTLTSRHFDKSTLLQLYELCSQRSTIAESKEFLPALQYPPSFLSRDRLQKYSSRFSKPTQRCSTNFDSSFQQNNTEPIKGEFKYKLKEKNILEKAKTKNAATLKKIEIYTNNQLEVNLFPLSNKKFKIKEKKKSFSTQK